ncbi:MAG: proton-conducting transporter membrane subunit [Pseudomonadota bacterium]|nr:proton-conducting transporter membrane subunit [Pseudomonadota bacterium]HJO35589.1 proton-conducting transporter membrane subunit [Gammaproteobacteria bacterium]
MPDTLPWHLPPGALLLLGALLMPLLPRLLAGPTAVLLPLVSLWHLRQFPAEVLIGGGDFFGLPLTPVRIDALALVFGTIFHFAAFAGLLYAHRSQGRAQHAAALGYAGSAIGAVFAGDLLTLFVFWELTSLTSVLLIWVRGGAAAQAAALRYLMLQIGSGLLLLCALVLQWSAGSLAFATFDPATPSGMLLLLAFGIKAGFPLLHTWLTEGYPAATATGAVFLSVFTTKMAIYALARAFPGTEWLLAVGVVMVVFTLIYAAAEDDLRRVLAYGLINQLGFMVIAIGIGSELAINGTAAHAVSHVLYKSLLFMALGAVMLRTGTTRASELGGLWRAMPLTALFCLFGALGMSAPLFAGFASKSLILEAAAKADHAGLWALLLAGSAGIFLVAGLKVVWFAFLGSGRVRATREAPWSMLAGMALTTTALLVLGVRPDLLLAHLPYPVDKAIYTYDHVITQLQLLLATALVFGVLVGLGLWRRPAPGELLDVDWLWRRALPWLLVTGAHHYRRLRAGSAATLTQWREDAQRRLMRSGGQQGYLARSWPTGSMVLWVAILLSGYLLLYFF